MQSVLRRGRFAIEEKVVEVREEEVVVVVAVGIQRARDLLLSPPSDESWIRREHRTPRESGIRCDDRERGKRPTMVVVAQPVVVVVVVDAELEVVEVLEEEDAVVVVAGIHRARKSPRSLTSNAGSAGSTEPPRIRHSL